MLARRRVLLEEQVLNFAEEVRGALHGSLWAHVGVVWKESQLAAIRAHPDDWYKDDAVHAEHFAEAAANLVRAKRRACAISGAKTLRARHARVCEARASAARPPAQACPRTALGAGLSSREKSEPNQPPPPPPLCFSPLPLSPPPPAFSAWPPAAACSKYRVTSLA